MHLSIQLRSCYQISFLSSTKGPLALLYYMYHSMGLWMNFESTDLQIKRGVYCIHTVYILYKINTRGEYMNRSLGKPRRPLRLTLAKWLAMT